MEEVVLDVSLEIMEAVPTILALGITSSCLVVLAVGLWVGCFNTTTNGFANGRYYEQIEVLVKFTTCPIHDLFVTRKFANFLSFVVVLRH